MPITFTLDRVDVGKGLFLTNASGALETGGGIHGTFRGLVNGVAGLTGQAIATGGRPALRLSATDAGCLLYTSPSPRDATLSRMPSSA